MAINEAYYDLHELDDLVSIWNDLYHMESHSLITNRWIMNRIEHLALKHRKTIVLLTREGLVLLGKHIHVN